MGSANTDPPLLSLLVKPSLLTWAWPRPTPSRTTSSGDPFSRSTDLPLLDLLATPSKPTWAWPRPTPAPVRKKSSGDPFSANTDPPLLSLLATPSKPTWAWPRPTPSLRKSSGDPFSRSTDPPLLDLLATPSKLTWAWPRPAPLPWRRRSSSLLLSPLPNWATLPTKCSALPKLTLPLPRRLSGDSDPFSRSTDPPLLDLLAKPSLLTWACPRPPRELSRVALESSSRRAPPSSARPSRQPSTSSRTAKPSGRELDPSASNPSDARPRLSLSASTRRHAEWEPSRRFTSVPSEKVWLPLKRPARERRVRNLPSAPPERPQEISPDSQLLEPLSSNSAPESSDPKSNAHARARPSASRLPTPASTRSGERSSVKPRELSEATDRLSSTKM